MKNYLTLSLLFLSITLFSQNFSGKAVYKTSKKSNFSIGDNNLQMTDEMKAQIQERMRKLYQKTYILEFTKNTSNYKQEVALKSPQSNIKNKGVRMVTMFAGSGGTSDNYYKNIGENRFVNQTEISGKRFLIKDDLPKYDWVMTSETKNIGMYTCYKATYTQEVENRSMKFINGEKKETVTKEKKTTTAWYTPQIPVSNGPKNYQGLPGLILEINDGKTTIVCSEIILDKSKTIEIKEPKKGKKVTLKEFRKIQKKKTDEMLEKMNSRNGMDLGNGIKIKMSGN